MRPQELSGSVQCNGRFVKRPRSITQMTSAATIVDSRCATAIVVRRSITGASADCTSRSDVASSALVASSRMRGSLQDHARDRDTLLLTTRQPEAALADDSVVTIGGVR